MNALSAAALVASLVVGTAASAQAVATAKLVPAQSSIGFTARQMGAPLEGSFTRFDVQSAFDPRHPETARVALSVDLASATLGSPEDAAELPKAEWFDTAKFPRATFQSAAVKSTGPGRFEMTGKLAIKGVARDVVVPVALAQSGGTTVATGAFSLKRLNYRIGDNEWKDTSMVADDVQVRFKFTLTGVPPL